MIVYIIKSTLCLLVLLGFYKAFLENEKFHNFKRFFLLGSLIFALLIPTITISYTEYVPVSEEVVYSGSQVSLEKQVAQASLYDVFVEKYLSYALLTFYLIGFSIFMFRFLRNLRNMNFTIRNNKKLNNEPYIYVLLRSKLDPHTFLNYIFLNRKEFRNNKIEKEVLLHEQAHVDQKHTWDILIIEFLQVVFWINPFFILLKRFARLNHEFLADEKVVKEISTPVDYSNLLYNYASSSHQAGLSSSISYSLTKKRIFMISKTFSIKKLLTKLGLLIPVLGCCIFLFNNEIVAKPIFISQESSTDIIADQQMDENQLNADVILNANQTDGDEQKQKNRSEEYLKKISVKIQEEGTLNIRVIDEKVWLNEEETKLKYFTERVDKVTSNWSDSAMRKPYFYIDFENSSTEFIQKLNKEYRKSKLSKISGTEFLAPSPVAPGGTPPPPPPPPVKARDGNVPPPAPQYSEHKLQKEYLFSIKVEGQKLWINGKQTKPKDFSKTLDKLTENWTEKKLKNSNFRMQIIDPDPGFMEKLNNEFKKTRLSKITGHDILPPPPPMPPSAEQVSPPPASVNEMARNEDIKKVHRERAREWKEKTEAQRAIINEERLRLIDKEKELKEDESLTKAERKRMFEDVKRKEASINRKMEGVDRKRKEIEREHMAIERKQKEIERLHHGIPVPPNPPSPPNPIEEISKIEKAGGSFYYNKEKISAEQAKKLISSKRDINIHINGKNGKAGKVEISDN